MLQRIRWDSGLIHRGLRLLSLGGRTAIVAGMLRRRAIIVTWTLRLWPSLRSLPSTQHLSALIHRGRAMGLRTR